MTSAPASAGGLATPGTDNHLTIGNTPNSTPAAADARPTLRVVGAETEGANERRTDRAGRGLVRVCHADGRLGAVLDGHELVRFDGLDECAEAIRRAEAAEAAGDRFAAAVARAELRGLMRGITAAIETQAAIDAAVERGEL